MTKQEQLKRLYEIQENIRVLQENGLWEMLQDPKSEIIKVIEKLKKRKK